ncbi:glycoside hydrolase family 43 protein [Spirosoma soli]|uniref:Glycoside hydrolase family 43 protein n=1 Tax=Spirosoma soli TaxID=1770529 RepID=A0ABW5M067_9BACT
MKNSLILFVFLLIHSLSWGQTQSNEDVYLFSSFRDNGQDGLHLAYSLDGYSWKALNDDKSYVTPVIGNTKLMRDPCIIQGPDKTFHMVWTVSWNDKGIGYANSKDLANWSEQQFIPVMAHEPTALNCWAPEIFYDEAKKTYMIYWATTIPGRFPKSEGAGDEKYNHRMYYVTTKDFKTFSDTQLLYDQGFNVIDATIVKNQDEYVMFLKDETRTPPQKNIRIARSNTLTGGYSKPTPPITGAYWAEGPTVAKIGQNWVVYFDKYTNKKMGAVQSADLTNWTDISDKIDFPTGTRHGTIIKVSKSVLNNLMKGK